MKQKNTTLRTRIDAWIPAPVRRQLLALLAAQCFFYWGAKLLTRSRFHHCMALPADDLIPLLPWTVIIYFGCFLFWAVNYTLILRTEPEGTHRFFFAELTGKFIAAVFFVAIPATLERPEITGSGLFPWLMRFLYRVDAPDALFPSVHCFVSWMCFLGLRGKPRISKAYKAFSAAMAVLVFFATLTTKQHVLVDVIAGFALAELVWHGSGVIEKRLRPSSCKKKDTPERGNDSNDRIL